MGLGESYGAGSRSQEVGGRYRVPVGVRYGGPMGLVERYESIGVTGPYGAGKVLKDYRAEGGPYGSGECAVHPQGSPCPYRAVRWP